MKLSKSGINLLKRLEGFRLVPYDDQTGDIITKWIKGATIGVGHLIKKKDWEKYNYGINIEEMESLLKSDIKKFEKGIEKNINIELSQEKFDALVIFSFNIGVKGFSNSSACKLINNPKAKTNYKNLKSAWLAWNKSQGKIMQGLINRRKAEYKLYSEGLYNE
jgi:type VI secretion system secreted protein VgrG